MSNKRLVRLTGTLLVFCGALNTTLALNGMFDDTEGTLWFPVAIVIGAAILVTNRPRTNKRKAANNGN